MKVIGRAAVGAGAAYGVAAGVQTYQTWDLKYTDAQQGSPSTRMLEVAKAFFVRLKMKDKPAAKEHLALVSTLPSKESTFGTGRNGREVKILNEEGYPLYLSRVWHDRDYYDWRWNRASEEENPLPFTFRYRTDLPIHNEKFQKYDENIPVYRRNPAMNSLPQEGFTFAGSSPYIEDEFARAQILDGNYVRCKAQIYPRDTSDGRRQPKVDVLITGTDDCSKCQQFENDLLSGFAKKSAFGNWWSERQVSPPYSKIPVYDCEDGTCVIKDRLFEEREGRGTMDQRLTVDPIIQKAISSDQFVACNSTETSDGSIIIGTKDARTCNLVAQNLSINKTNK